MSTRRNYSDREKGTALAALDSHLGNVEGTARELGIPGSTLEQWAKGQDVNSEAGAYRRRTSVELAD